MSRGICLPLESLRFGRATCLYVELTVRRDVFACCGDRSMECTAKLCKIALYRERDALGISLAYVLLRRFLQAVKRNSVCLFHRGSCVLEELLKTVGLHLDVVVVLEGLFVDVAGGCIPLLASSTASSILLTDDGMYRMGEPPSLIGVRGVRFVAPCATPERRNDFWGPFCLPVI